MVDLNTTVGWVKRVLQQPEAAAADYGAQVPWQQTFTQIVLPVYVAAYVVGFIVSWLFDRPMTFGAMAGAPLLFLLSLAWGVAWLFVLAFILDYFAGVFGGARNYNAAYATLALAMIPSALGSALSPLPWIGWLIGLAASIYALVLLYRFVPLIMTVPDTSRLKHFWVSIIVGFLVNLVVLALLGSLFVSEPSAFDGRDVSETAVDGADTAAPGMFGGLERQAGIAERAAEDRFEPPADGRLTEAQVQAYASALAKTAALRERLAKNLEKLEQKEPSLTDVFGGVGDALRTSTAEMEVVKTAGGNWAEHQWVREQIEIARVQQDLNPTVEHNYRLFLEYQDAIEQHE